MSIDEIREQRQARANQKAARYREQAEKREQEADRLQAEFNSYRGDAAFMTQPSNPNRPFTKQRNRIVNRYDKGVQLRIEAQELREKADYLEQHGGRVAGDAERKREKRREALDALIHIGSRVWVPMFNRSGTVKRINRKTYRVLFESGYQETLDKTFVQLIREDQERGQA